MGLLWGMLWTLPNLMYVAAMPQGLVISINEAVNWPLIAFVLLLGTQVWLVWEADRLCEVQAGPLKNMQPALDRQR